jgi:hypothetical protein
MFYSPGRHADWQTVSRPHGLPVPLDSEALSLLRLFLTPVLEQADSWSDLDRTLAQKGYGLTFRQGRLIVLNDHGEALCTGRDLGVPLATLADRIGRPCVRADRTGQTGDLILSQSRQSV